MQIELSDEELAACIVALKEAAALLRQGAPAARRVGIPVDPSWEKGADFMDKLRERLSDG